MPHSPYDVLNTNVAGISVTLTTRRWHRHTKWPSLQWPI